jgi:16S rRNA (guanine966-N2)-methyltransferase
MTRIIGGFAGSLSLTVPAAGTRPTSDRVREAIFSALQSRDVVAGARVLDLYAGSGALGLEAISRGAASAVLVDNGSRAVDACRKNAAHILKAAPKGNSAKVDVSSSPALAYLSGARQFWDIIFIDPPYELSNADLAPVVDALAPRLAPDATVVLERSSRMPEPNLPAELILDRRKDYGDTSLYWLTTH